MREIYSISDSIKGSNRKKINRLWKQWRATKTWIALLVLLCTSWEPLQAAEKQIHPVIPFEATAILIQPAQIPPPLLPGDPNQIPVTGGWLWLISGAVYGVRKMRRDRMIHDSEV